MGPTNATSMITSTNWGRAPTLMEAIPATVSLAWPARHLSVWALDTNGVRKTSVPVADAGGKGTFVIGREYQTAWYEVATYANAAPGVQITSPANGANFSPPPATVTMEASATDSDGAIAKVEFFNGATKLGETNAPPYRFVWTNVTQGSYTLTARATDDELTTATSSPVNITVGVVITSGATLPGGDWNSACANAFRQRRHRPLHVGAHRRLAAPRREPQRGRRARRHADGGRHVQLHRARHRLARLERDAGVHARRRQRRRDGHAPAEVARHDHRRLGLQPR
jgi:hypothetical protein